MTFAHRLRELRKSQRWTQRELADKISVSPQVVSNWEREYSAPDTDDVANLAKLFDVPADYLLLGRTQPAAPEPAELTPEESAVLQEMRRHPNFRTFFHDLSSAPEEKIRKLIRMWEIIREDLDNDDDEEPIE